MKRRLHLPESILLISLPAVIWLFVNASVNLHIHVMPDGYLFPHAHPHEKTEAGPIPVEKHHHSQSELILLNFFSEPIVLVVTLFFSGLFFLSFIREIPVQPVYPEPSREYYQVNNYHAPPFLS